MSVFNKELLYCCHPRVTAESYVGHCVHDDSCSHLACSAGDVVCGTESWQCPAGFARCIASRQCVRDYLFCDGVNDCDVGTDEDHAFCGNFLSNLLH